MPGLGLKPTYNGSDVLPEMAASAGLDSAARSVTSPPPPPGLGLAKPVAIPDVEPPPVSSPPLSAPDVPPDGAPSAPAPQDTSSLYDFDKNPLRSIGLALANFGAGFQGQPLPGFQLQKQKIEEQAFKYKTAELGMNVIEAATKQLTNRPASEHGAIIADFEKRFGPVVGSIKPILTAISDGGIKDAQAKVEAARQTGLFTPQMLAYLGNDPGSLDKVMTAVLENRANRKTPDETWNDAYNSTAGTEQAKADAGIAPSAPTTRTRVDGQKEIVEQWNGKGWTKVSEAPRFNDKPEKTLDQIKAEAQARAEGDAAGTPVKMTDAQATTAIYADRTVQAEKDLKGVIDVGSKFWENLKSNWGGNYASSSEFQRFDQARRNFLTAVLRKESGAVISPEEMKEGDKQYFPQPGNDDKVLAQKAKNRGAVIEGLKRAAGPAYGGKDKPDPLGIR